MQFAKPEASEMQIQRVPWQGSSTIWYLSMGWVRGKAFPSGGRKAQTNKQKVLAKDTSQATQVTATSCAQLALQVGCSPSAMHWLHASDSFENKTLASH